MVLAVGHGIWQQRVTKNAGETTKGKKARKPTTNKAPKSFSKMTGEEYMTWTAGQGRNI